MATTKLEFLSPLGRLVQGSVWKPYTADLQGNQLTIKSGPRQGQATQVYTLNVAVSKQDPDLGPFLAKMYDFARQAWPQFMQGPAAFDGKPGPSHPQFSMKWQDGDGVDGTGQPNSGKEGYAGHIILRFESSYAPKAFYKDHYAPHEEIKDENLLVTGDYIRVGGVMDTNGFATKPGIKLYASAVALCGKGTPIVSGPNAQAIFGTAGAGFAMPGMQPLPGAPVGGGASLAAPGALAAPLAPMQPAVGGAPAIGGFALPAVASPAVALQPAAAAPVLATPNPAFAAGPGAVAPLQPLQPVQPLQPLAPPAPTLTPACIAAGHTWDTIKGMGTVEQLRAAGYVV